MSIERTSLRAIRNLIALGILGCAIGPYSTRAPASEQYGSEIPAWSVCLSERESDETIREYAKLLNPPDGAAVQTGTPVTFSARSGIESPMTFSFASSATLLSSPDVDRGVAMTVSPTEDTFTSTVATAIPRTVYWTASFTREQQGCKEPVVPFTLPTRTLIVLPATPIVSPPPLQLSISSVTFRLARSVVSYRITCTTNCSGHTYFQAWLVRRRSRSVRVPELDFVSTPVSIGSATGGFELFTRRYSGRELRLLTRVLHHNGAVELRISTEATDAFGGTQRTQSTAWLR